MKPNFLPKKSVIAPTKTKKNIGNMSIALNLSDCFSKMLKCCAICDNCMAIKTSEIRSKKAKERKSRRINYSVSKANHQLFSSPYILQI